MIEINLLPKELQYKRFGFSINKNIIYLIISGLTITAMLVAYSFIFQANKIMSLEDEIMMAQSETAKYTGEISRIEDITLKKDQIVARKTAIQVLDQNRNYWVKLLEDLVRRVPDYVWLTNVEQSSQIGMAQAGGAQGQAQGAKSIIEGYSFSLNAFATFLVRLKKSAIFEDIELISVKLQETDKAKAYFFKLTCNFAMPEMPVATMETAQTPPAAGTQF